MIYIYIIALITVIILIGIGVRLFPKKYDFVIGESGINKVETVRIGGIDQTILVQGEDVTKPVLLFLHGGPSMPMPGVSSRGMDYTIATNTRELVKNYIVVFWDQRGTGKSYHKLIPQDSMNVAQFVSDTIELTDYLRNTYDQEKIFLAGHSWGTIIGLMAADRHPEKYYSYVGISQVVNWTENDRLGLKWAKEEAKRRNHHKALAELNSVGEPPFVQSTDQWTVLRKWQRKFGTLVYTDEHIKHPGLAKITMDMLRSKEYSLKDMFNTLYKGFQLVYTYDFIHELPKIDFARTTPKVKLPVTFIHGTRDVHVFGNLVQDYVEGLDAEQGKQMIWLDQSGHAFHPDDTKKIEQLLIDEQKHLQKNNGNSSK